MMNIGSRTRVRLAVGGTFLVLPLAFAITACSGGGSHPAAASATVGTTQAVASATTGAVSQAGTTGKTVKVPKYIAADNGRKDVLTKSCAQAKGKGWTLKGTAHNPTAAARSYSIVVDFVTTKGDTVLDTKVLKVGPVKSKATADWSASGAAGAQSVSCVIRQVQIK